MLRTSRGNRTRTVWSPANRQRVRDRVVRPAVKAAGLEVTPIAGLVLLLEDDALAGMIRGDGSGERDRLAVIAVVVLAAMLTSADTRSNTVRL